MKIDATTVADWWPVEARRIAVMIDDRRNKEKYPKPLLGRGLTANPLNEDERKGARAAWLAYRRDLEKQSKALERTPAGRSIIEHADAAYRAFVAYAKKMDVFDLSEPGGGR